MLHEALFELRPGGPWYTTDDEWFWTGDESDKPTDAEVQALSTQYDNARPLKELRETRTKLLAESDWMANSDVTMSDAWRTYRQALRDLPANTSDPANPVWPTKPS
jgi:hypothetical protein